MISKKFIAPIVGAAVIAATALVLIAARRSPTLESTDFDKVVRVTNPAYDARLDDASRCRHQVIPDSDQERNDRNRQRREIRRLDIRRHRARPVIRVRVGDKVRVNVINESPMPHSIDFHSRANSSQ
jgi:hypothetical protein